MCGIAGHLELGAASVEVVDRQLAVLAHRGPDASGSFVRGRAAVGQNRLAIIDLVTGDPPITNEDGTVGVAFNGEIYNYRELREALRREGHRLSTDGDTEVLAHLAETLSPTEVARRLDGMFAFAIFDDRTQRLLLGRDRLGKKPLYYWAAGGRLVFGSEIKAVLAHPQVPREPAPRALPAYLTFGYVPTPNTFFRGVRSLPPGHVLTMRPGEEPRIEAYWSPPRGPDRPNGHRAPTLDQAARELREHLTAAVQRRLIADVPLGAFLSGGIDSSIIVALMSELSERPVRTFTIGFEHAGMLDERPYAAQVAKRWKTDHVEFVVDPEAVDLVDRLVWHHDQPFGDSSAIPTYLLSQLTRNHVTVALCGDGGDELFGGYERFSVASLVDAYSWVPQVVQNALVGAARRLPDDALRGRVASVRRFAEGAGRGMPDAYLGWVSTVPKQRRDELLGKDGDDWAMRQYQLIWRSSEGSSQVDRLLDLNLRTYLVDDLLVKADRMSMAHALEVRSPLLDTALLEFAAGLPPGHKLRGWSRKRVLKRACQELLPPEVLSRRKRGFAVPLDAWFRSDLRSYVQSMLGSAQARVRRHLAPPAIDSLLEEHARGRVNHGHALWTLLTLEVFLRREGW